MSATLEAYRMLAAKRISLRQLVILAALDAATGELTTIDLSAATGIARNPLSYYYRALAKRGLVSLHTQPIPAGALRVVRLTEKGRAIAKATRLSNDQVEQPGLDRTPTTPKEI